MMNTDGLILPVAVKSIIPLSNMYLLPKDLRDSLFKTCSIPTYNWVYLWVSIFFCGLLIHFPILYYFSQRHYHIFNI